MSILTVAVSLMLCYQIVSEASANQTDKKDFAELNHVYYGLFSVDEWKRKITLIVVDEIDNLELSRTNKRELRAHIIVLLNELINQVDEGIRKENAKSLPGRVKQSLINVFVNREEIKKGLPDYADAIMKEMTSRKPCGR